MEKHAVEEFNDYEILDLISLPSDNYGFCHTIKEFKIFYGDKNNLYEVELS